MITKIKQKSTNLQVTLEDGSEITIPEGYSGWLTEHINNFSGIIEPEFTQEELNTKFENEFRQNRDKLLSTVVDHYQKPLIWETLTVEQQDKVRTYRQALLDSTNNWILPEELVL